MSEQEKGTGVYSPGIIQFVRTSNDFCEWLEQEEEVSAVEFISTAVKQLSRLYHDLLQMDQTEPMLEGGNERFVSEQDWSRIFQKVLHLLGPHNEYLRIAHDGEYDRSDLVSHKISEDLADIYQDIKDFTMQYRQGVEEIMNDAVWEVMDHFDQYWSAKALNALMALNQLYTKKIDPSEEGAQEIDPEQEIPTYDNSFFTRLQDLNEEGEEE